MYPLADVLLLCLLAVLAGSNGAVDTAQFGQKKLDVLRRFSPFRDRTPSHDQVGDILAALDAAPQSARQEVPPPQTQTRPDGTMSF